MLRSLNHPVKGTCIPFPCVAPTLPGLVLPLVMGQIPPPAPAQLFHWQGWSWAAAGALCHVHVTVPTAPFPWLAGILAQLQPIVISGIKAAVKHKQKLVAFAPGGKRLQPVLDAARLGHVCGE